MNRQFPHHKLHAFTVAREAFVRGTAIASQLPRGHANLADQVRRALLSAYLQIAEASARSGADRVARFRVARGETCEAAAGIEAVQLLGLASGAECDAVLELLDRVTAMLSRLAPRAP